MIMCCTLGVGCYEYGVCYADAHGEPLRCPCYRPTYIIALLALRRRRRR